MTDDNGTRSDAGIGGSAGGRDGGGGGNGKDSGTNPPPTQPPPPTGSDATSICVDKINAYRATLGLPPYARWSDKEVCASGQAKSDSETSKPHGAFGKCSEWAQNECPGWPGPAEKMIPGCLEMMWGEGPGGGHYDNMSSKKYTKVACGFYTMPNGKVWAVQDFQ
ncbi:CAP domain-containing protein [Pendulispora albinea]|uniref:CAP domain-containing protein n=1 Tax=Pendulispora albinea TaxID=2741071 RepID=A0ABZ2M255_9BACT